MTDTEPTELEQSSLADEFPPDDSPDYRCKDTEKPYRDPEVLHRLYWHEEMGQVEIAEHLGCGQGTVGEWMRKLGIPRRSMMDAINLNTPDHQPMCYHPEGYPGWNGAGGRIGVHRLLAVAKFGIEPVKGMHAHHKNGVLWDNRPGNIELVSNNEHQRQHREVEFLDRIAVAEKYEHGDISSRDLGDMYGVTQSTILKIRDEFFGDERLCDEIDVDWEDVCQ